MFNQRIDDTTRFPAHAQSAAWIAAVGAARRLHADWGTNDNVQQFDTYYGIPYNIVDGSNATTLWPQLSFDASDPGNGAGVPDESDCAVASGNGFNLVQARLQSRLQVEPLPLATAQSLSGRAGAMRIAGIERKLRPQRRHVAPSTMSTESRSRCRTAARSGSCPSRVPAPRGTDAAIHAALWAWAGKRVMSSMR